MGDYPNASNRTLVQKLRQTIESPFYPSDKVGLRIVIREGYGSDWKFPWWGEDTYSGWAFNDRGLNSIAIKYHRQSE